MSDTSGLPNTDNEGVPREDDPSRFEGDERDAQAAEPAETEDPAPADGQQADGQADGQQATGQQVPSQQADGRQATGQQASGAQAEPDASTGADATGGTDGAEPPPAEFDPAQNPSNPDLVDTTEAPD